MATIDYTATQTYTEFPGGNVAMYMNEVDYSVTNLTGSDIGQVLAINAGDLVWDFRTRLQTLEGGVATGDMGDTDDSNGYDDAVDFDATAGDFFATTKGTDAYALGRLYTSDDTIDQVVDNTLDTAVVQYFALVVKTEGLTT